MERIESGMKPYVIKSYMIRLLTMVLSFMMLAGSFPLPAQAGTLPTITPDTAWYTADPSAISFSIATKEELAGLAELVNREISPVNFYDKTIVLSDDINLSGYQWVPIGIKADRPFCGVFKGKDSNGTQYTIKGLTITGLSSEAQGLFGYAGNPADNYGNNERNSALVDVSLSDVDISAASARYVGGLVGRLQGSLINCNVSGRIVVAAATLDTQTGYGGLAGMVQGTLSTESYYNNITDSYALMDIAVTNDYYSYSVGGLIGYTSGVHISNSFAMGNLTAFGRDGNIGGLVGEYNWGDIQRSYASCRIEVTSVSPDYNYRQHRVGGLVGNLNLYKQQQLSKSYATGSITVSGAPYTGAKHMVGGLVGMGSGQYDQFEANYAAMKRNYAAVLIRVAQEEASRGGLAGYLNYFQLNDNYFNKETSRTIYVTGTAGNNLKIDGYPSGSASLSGGLTTAMMTDNDTLGNTSKMSRLIGPDDYKNGYLDSYKWPKPVYEDGQYYPELTVFQTSGNPVVQAHSKESVRVIPLPVITRQPFSDSAKPGDTSTFDVVAEISDGSELTYQWQKSANGTNWTDITGGTTRQYTTSPLALGDNNTWFRVIVTKQGTDLSVTSAAAVLTVSATAPSKDAGLKSVGGVTDSTPGAQSGTILDPIQWKIIVPNKNMPRLDLMTRDYLPTDSGASISIYPDNSFQNWASGFGIMAGGTGTSYVKVTAANPLSVKYYAVEITYLKNTDGGLKSVAGYADNTPGTQTGVPSDPITWKIAVSNGKVSLEPAEIIPFYAQSKISLYGKNSFAESDKVTSSLPLTPGGDTTAYIKVTAEDGTTEKYYAVTISRAANSDAGLASVAGQTDSNPGTESGTSSYSPISWKINVPGNTASIQSPGDIVPTDSRATVTLYATSSFSTPQPSLALIPGQTTTAYMLVTAQNTMKKYYKVDIAREKSSDVGLANVAELTDNNPGGQPGSKTEPITWALTLPNSAQSLAVADIKASDSYASVTLYGDEGDNVDDQFTNPVESLPLAPNGMTTVYIQVMAQDGVTVKYYQVALTSVKSSKAELKSVTGQTDSHPGTQVGTAEAPITWNINVPNSTARLIKSDILGTDGNAVIALYASPFTAQTDPIDTLDLVPNGSVTAYIKVTAEDGSQETYYAVDISRAIGTDATLKSVLAKTYEGVVYGAGTLGNPLLWSISVPASTETLAPSQIIPTDSLAKVALYSDVNFSSPITESKPLALTQNYNTPAYIKVTAQDSAVVKYYRVTIYRPLNNEANLVSVARQKDENPTGTGAFGSPIQWKINVPGDKTTLTKEDLTGSLGATVTLHNSNSFSTAIQTLDLPANSSKTAYIRVISQDASVYNYYAVEITRPKSTDATLKSVIGMTDPAATGTGEKGNPVQWNINVNVTKSQLLLTDILPTDINATKVLYSDKEFSASVPVFLDLVPGGITTAYIQVTAQDNTVAKYYEIKITRPQSFDATLKSVDGQNFTGNSSGGNYLSSPITWNISVPYSKTQLQLKDILPNDAYATVELYSDNAFSTKIDPLELKTDGYSYTYAYIKITAQNPAYVKYYAVGIQCAKNNDAGLASVAGKTDPAPGSQTGVKTNPITWAIKVPNSRAALTSAAVLPTDGNATIQLYSDGNFSSFVYSSLALAVNQPTIAYIVVTAQDGSTQKYYAVTVTREAPADPEIPIIVIQPEDVTVNPNTQGAFTVYAMIHDGGLLTYQWQKQAGQAWVDLDGATAPQYFVPEILAVAGSSAQYRCVVTNTLGGKSAEAISETGTLTVSGQWDDVLPPTIVTHPRDMQIYSGNGGQLTVNAFSSDGGTLTYQWQKAADGMAWSTIAGATSPQIYLSLTTAESGTKVRCVVTNTRNGKTAAKNSNAATVTVLSGYGQPSYLIINSQPQDVSAAPGDKAMFMVNAYMSNYSDPVSYQWQKSMDGKSWSEIAGATTMSYMIDSLTLGDDGTKYRCILTALANGVTTATASATATLTVKEQSGSSEAPAVPVIVHQPQDATFLSGTGMYKSVFALAARTDDGGVLTYQWQKLIGGVWTELADFMSPAYFSMVNFTSGEDNTKFRCVVTNTKNGQTATVTSQTVTLTVKDKDVVPSIIITNHPQDTKVFSGQQAQFSVSAQTGDSVMMLSYQWQKSTDGVTWTNISAATGQTYLTPPVIPADKGTQFRCIVKNPNNNATATSGAGTLGLRSSAVLAAAPVIGEQPEDTGVGVNSTATFTVQASVDDGGVLSYQWQKLSEDGVWEGIAGATGTSYTTGILSLTDSDTKVRVIVTNTKNGTTATATSNAATLTVTSGSPTTPVKPTLNGTISDVTAAESSTATFTVQASVSDGGTLSYRWQKLGKDGVWSNINGAAGMSYTTGKLTAEGDNGTKVRVIVTNTKDGKTTTATSNAATLTVTSGSSAEPVKPTLNGEISNVTAAEGSTATFTVQATVTDGGTLSYQWQKSSDGTTWSNITGATGVSYTTGNLTMGDDKTKVRVIVTNTKDGKTATATSNTATLNVTSGSSTDPVIPILSGMSDDVTAEEGSAVIFSVLVIVTDRGTLSYQWQKLSEDGVWSDISEATDAHYATGILNTADSGTKYRVIVTNTKYGKTAAATSNVVTLTVTSGSSTEPDVPDLTGLVNSVTALEGYTAAFSVQANVSDGGTLSYQWQKSGDGTTWRDIEGATAADYTTGVLTTADSGTKYQVIITNTKNGKTAATTSNTATLTVISGSVTGPAAPTLNGAVKNVTAAEGSTATFTVQATVTDGGTLSYQWQKSGDGTTWNDIAGATDTSCTTGNLTTADSGTKYRVIVTNTKDGKTATATSNTATLTVTSGSSLMPVTPTLSGAINNVTAAEGETATFTVQATVTDGGILSYQWQMSSDDGTTWSDLSGAVGESYTTGSLTAADSGTKVRVIVTNTKDGKTATVTSNTGTLTVTTGSSPEPDEPEVPTLSGTINNVTAAEGKTAAFTVQAGVTDGGTLSYQWQMSSDDGTTWRDISGAIGESYTTGSLTAADSGTKVRVIITNTKNDKTAATISNTATLTVTSGSSTEPDVPNLTAMINNVTAVEGDTATFTVQAGVTDGGTLSYQWQMSSDNGTTWSDISGAIDESYRTGALTTADSGTKYQVIITNTKNGQTATTTSNTATLTVISGSAIGPVAPTLSGAVRNVTAAEGSKATFTVQASVSDGGTLSYQWQKSSDSGTTWSDVSGAIDESYTTGNLTAADSGTKVRAIVTNTKDGKTATVTSNVAALTVTSGSSTTPVTPTLSGTINDVKVAEGSPATFTVQATVTDGGVLSYQWQKSSDGTTWSSIAGATGTSCTTGKLTAADSGTKVRVIVTNTKDGKTATVTSNVATLTVTSGSSTTPVTPTLSGTINDVTVAEGSPATFTVQATVTDGGVLSYQWQKSSDGTTWSSIAGATGASCTTGNLTIADSGTKVRVIVTNTKDGKTATVTSNTATLTVKRIAAPQTPGISQHPTNTSAKPGQQVIFTVKASVNDGGVLSYQWQKSGDGTTWSDIVGATGTNHTTGTLSANEDGVKYRVIVTNTKDGMTSQAVSRAGTLKVVLPTEKAKKVEEEIDALPDPKDATDEEIKDKEQDIKKTKQDYDDLNEEDRDSVDKTKKDKLNDLINRLNALLIIRSHDTGTDVSLSGVGTAVRLPELNDPKTGKVIVQIEVTPYTESNLPNSMTIAITDLASDGKKILKSYDIALLKLVYDSADNQLSSGKVKNSDVVEMITVRIPVPQEYRGRADLAVTYIDDLGNVTFFEAAYVTENGVDYLEFATDHFSNYAIVADQQVTDPMISTIGSQPRSVTMNSGEKGTFSVQATVTDGGTLRYQWQISTDGGKTWVNIAGATGSSYTTDVLNTSNSGAQYRSIITNTKGGKTATIISTAAVLTVVNTGGGTSPSPVRPETPTIESQPRPVTVKPGEKGTFNVQADVKDGGTLSYQWQISTDGGKTWADITGAIGPSYITDVLSGSNNGALYRSVITNTKRGKTATAITTFAALTVEASGGTSPSPVRPETPTIGSQPRSVTIKPGEKGTFNVQADVKDGGTLSYQWQISTDGGKTWADITGATGPSYTTDVLSGSNNGAQYRNVITNTKDRKTTVVTTTTATVVIHSGTKMLPQTGQSIHFLGLGLFILFSAAIMLRPGKKQVPSNTRK